ncbi:hypothetical protein BT69DRAFT_1335446 [Atractiella rhizophila]|nr:hypothetical protein BT69DRAFT_1335446 [Atractiella rhizophila]
MASANGPSVPPPRNAAAPQQPGLSAEERKKLQRSRSNSSHHIFVHANDALFDHYQDTDVDDKQFSRNIFKNPAWLKLIARGTVLRVIWPEWIGHTLWAVFVVVLSKNTPINLGISNVLLTVLGVLIGFVVPYRVSASYASYWAGRSAWGDCMRHSRTLARLMWFNVPTCTKKYAEDETVPKEELESVLEEKKAFLDLILAFAVSLKHRLRSEHGIYYDDLYPLVCDMPQFNRQNISHDQKKANDDIVTSPTSASSPFPSVLNALSNPPPNTTVNSTNGTGPKHSETAPLTAQGNEYGTFSPSSGDSARDSLLRSVHAATEPVPVPAPAAASSAVLQPSHTWAAWTSSTMGSVSKPKKRKTHRVEYKQDTGNDAADSQTVVLIHRKLKEFKARIDVSGKHVPQMEDLLKKKASKGDQNDRCLNIPLEIVWALSAYLYVLEKRNNVGGNPLGQLYANVLALEDDLTTMEKILTCPLPVIYALHLRHAVWIYLLFMPLQLLPTYGPWLTVLGTTLAAFFFLGFIAAGEEIEQPFGYDDNDLDLDLFVEEIIAKELQEIKEHLPPDVAEGFKEINKQEDSAAKWMRKRRKWRAIVDAF